MHRQRREEEAIACWDRLLAGLPDSARRVGADRADPRISTRRTPGVGQVTAEYLEQKARCLRDLGRLEEALAVLRQAEQAAGDELRAIAIGDMLRQLGRYEEALDQYDRCLLPWPPEPTEPPARKLPLNLQPGTLLRAIEKRILMNGKAGQVVPLQPGTLDKIRNIRVLEAKCLCLAHLERWREADAALDPATLPREGPSQETLDQLRPLVKFKLGDVAGATRALHAFMGSSPYSLPLTGDVTIGGFAVPAEYRTLAEDVYSQYAHRRKPPD
jgi:tetratricopeptide (TPR) repeat protein